MVPGCSLCGVRSYPYSGVMTATDTPLPGVSGTPATFESLDPRTGDVVGTHPVHDADAVDGRRRAGGGRRAVVGRRSASPSAAAGWASGARPWCAGSTTSPRSSTDETGKPIDDARLELVLAIDHLDWAAKHAERVLAAAHGLARHAHGNQAATL